MSEQKDASNAGDQPDCDHLLPANLLRIFNERDPAKRALALEELYVAEPVMFEPAALVEGRDAISATAGKLLEQFGPEFRFEPVHCAVGHHGMHVLRWRAGPKDGPVVVTGIDAAEVIDGRISRLWVLIDPRPLLD